MSLDGIFNQHACALQSASSELSRIMGELNVESPSYDDDDDDILHLMDSAEWSRHRPIDAPSGHLGRRSIALDTDGNAQTWISNYTDVTTIRTRSICLW